MAVDFITRDDRSQQTILRSRLSVVREKVIMANAAIIAVQLALCVKFSWDRDWY